MTEFIGGALAMLDGGYWLPLLFNMVLKGSVILVLAVCIRRLLRDSSASIRHAVGASALLALLALPLMWTLLPAWHVPFLTSPPAFYSALAKPVSSQAVARSSSQDGIPQQVSPQKRLALDQRLTPSAEAPSSARRALQSSTPLRGAELGSSTAARPLAATGHADVEARDGEALDGKEMQTASEPAARSQPHESVWQTSSAWLQARWPAVIAGFWMAGALLVLLRLFYAMLGVWWLATRSRPCEEPAFQRTVDQVRRRLAVARRVRLVFSDHLEVALSLGLWRPVIVLPSEARRWSRARLESILLHEMAHVRRWDNVFNVLAQAVAAFYWFHPLMWWLQSRLTVDREQACDNAVLEAGTRAPEYAQHLLQVARAVLPTRRRLLRTLEVSQSSALKDRLEAILEGGRNRSAFGGLGGAVILSALMMAAPLAALRPWVEPGISLTHAQSETVARRSTPQTAEPKPKWKPEPGHVPHPRFKATESRLSWDAAGATFLASDGWVPAGRTDAEVQAPEAVNVDARLRADAAAFQERVFSGQSLDLSAPSGLPLADPSRLTFTSIAFPARSGDGSPADPVDDPGNRVDDPGSPEVPEDPGDQEPEPEEPGGQDPEPEDPQNPDPEDPSDGDEGEVTMDAFTPTGVDGPFGQALDVNEGGTSVGIATTEQGEFRPFIWDERSGMRLLDTLGGFGGSQLVYGINRWESSSARAVAVNDRDQVIGISPDSQGRMRSFFWSQSTGMLDMGDLGGGETQVRALNERGQAVGFSYNAEGRKRAFIWTLQDGLRDLGGDAAQNSEAYDINDLGQVVGSIAFRAFLWEEGAGMFRLASEEIVGSAEAINNSGAVVGWARFDRGDPRRAFLWTPQDGMEDLGTLGEEFDSSRAVGINEEGVVLGASSTPYNLVTGQQTQRAFVWNRPDGMVDIDAYGGGGEHVPELAINNDRRVASRLPAHPLSGSIQSYMWTPGQGTVLLSGQQEEEFHISSPTALNDLGEVAGTALVSNSDPFFGNIYQPVVWRPRRVQDSEDALPDPLDDLRETLDGLDPTPGSDVREMLDARLSAAARKLSAGELRQAQIDLFRFAVLAEQALHDQDVSAPQGRRLIESAVSLMEALGR